MNASKARTIGEVCDNIDPIELRKLNRHDSLQYALAERNTLMEEVRIDAWTFIQGVQGANLSVWELLLSIGSNCLLSKVTLKFVKNFRFCHGVRVVTCSVMGSSLNLLSLIERHAQ